MGFEVIVVGAGPTGLMLAAELALADVRTRVVERRTEATRNSRALTLHPRSVELMDLRGIARRFLSEGPTAPGWHFANLPTPLDFSRLDSRRGYTLVLPQARTEAILETRARELGVRIDRGQQVVGLEQDAAGVSVEVRDVAGGVTEDRALFVVGCDGGRSFVRQAAGIGFPGTDETLTGMLGDFAELEPSPAALEAARAAGVLIVPAGDGLTRLVVIDPERMRRPSSACGCAGGSRRNSTSSSGPQPNAPGGASTAPRGIACAATWRRLTPTRWPGHASRTLSLCTCSWRTVLATPCGMQTSASPTRSGPPRKVPVATVP